MAATPELLAKPASCQIEGYSFRNLLQDGAPAGGVAPGTYLFWGLGSLLFSLAFGVAYLQLFKRHSYRMMVSSCCLSNSARGGCPVAPVFAICKSKG